jgi:hypothetical protein
MLVDMGDLPEPETGVLSENLFGGPTVVSNQATPSLQQQPLQQQQHMQHTQPPIPYQQQILQMQQHARGAEDMMVLSQTPSVAALSYEKESLRAAHEQSRLNGSSSYKGVLSSADATSHLYASKPWATAGLGSDMQAVLVGASPTSQSTSRPEEETKVNISSPPALESTRSQSYEAGRNLFSQLPQGGSLLQNINGKKPVDNRDYSLVTGLPVIRSNVVAFNSPSSSSTSHSKPAALPVSTGSSNGKSQQPYAYNAYVTDVNTEASTMANNLEIEKSAANKRKLEET